MGLPTVAHRMGKGEPELEAVRDTYLDDIRGSSAAVTQVSVGACWYKLNNLPDFQRRRFLLIL